MWINTCIFAGQLKNTFRKAGGILVYYLATTGRGLQVGYNGPFTVFYKGNLVGEYFADMVVNGKIVLEIKSVRAFGNEHVAQLLNYLHISRCRLGYLLNFQNSRLEFKRLVL